MSSIQKLFSFNTNTDLIYKKISTTQEPEAIDINEYFLFFHSFVRFLEISQYKPKIREYIIFFLFFVER